MPFQPGQSGNPGGRPRETKEVRELARQYTAAAIKTLVTHMASENGKVACYAAVAILDRGWGKPTQPIDGDGEGGPIGITVEVVRFGKDPAPK